MVYISYRSGDSIHAIPSRRQTVPEAIIEFKWANPHIQFLDCFEVPDND